MTTGTHNDAVDPRIGTLAAGKYKILRLLGQGGMGSVYEALNVSIGKRVALKFVVLGRDADPSSLVRFHREARAVSAIESDHIVQVFDTGETESGEPFLVMELLQGEDLGARLRSSGRLSVRDAVALAIEALRGLKRAHAAGIVHRDLKPENLFLVRGDDDRTHVKIVDFGLSKFRDPSGEMAPGSRPPLSLTQEGTTIGTPLYMSPEQVEALPDVDQRTDLWSMGAILYEALAGTPPFPEKSYPKLILAICQRDPQDISRLVPELPAGVARAVAQALARDRAARYQTADAFLAALQQAMPEVDAALASSGAISGQAASAPAARSSQRTPGEPSPQPPGAELRTYTAGGATMWVSQSPAFSIWRGAVDTPDRLRIEARDGTLHELRLEPVGPLKLGRTERVGDEKNELVYPDVASRLAATMRHDGVRWWLKRREECSVPVQVGSRALNRGEEAPLVHGTFLTVGGMRATMVDRRYVTPAVPAGAVDPQTGLLDRAGLEQEVASFLQRGRPGALILLRAAPMLEKPPPGAEYPPLVLAAARIHEKWGSLVIAHAERTVVLLSAAEGDGAGALAREIAAVARAAGLGAFTCGHWALVGDGLDAGREIELALHAVKASAEAGGGDAVLSLRNVPQNVRFTSAAEVITASRESKRATLLFAIEEQNALAAVGGHVVGALEQELSAVVGTHVGQGALVAQLAPGVVGAVVTRKGEPAQIANNVLCEWHSRPPVMDGKVELPRTLSWEILHLADPVTRAEELARECADPHGVLSALSGGLPYPIAGRVHAAISASSAIERVKILFDVLEGTWRFIATVLLSAYFARRTTPGENPPGFEQMIEFKKRQGTRDGFALGTWRELARIAAKAFEAGDDPIGAMAKDVLSVKLAQNQTFDQLSNLMQVERNGFAHGHYNEAKAAADLQEFEQMTRTLLRALRPLCAWTLVTVEKTEPDLYGEQQSVEFVDHTGPFNMGTRRRIGLNSPVRLANVVYLARFREGLVLPLDPLVRRIAHEDKFDLYWMDHLPRAGNCVMTACVGGASLKVPMDLRRLPPLLRTLASEG